MNCTCQDDDKFCDACWERTRAEHAYLRNVPRYSVINDEQAERELRQELIDAGRSQVLPL